MKCSSIRLRSGDGLGHCRIFYSWVDFAVCFESSFICIMKRHPINFAAFSWIWLESISLFTSEFIRLLLSSVLSSLNTSNTSHWKLCSCFTPLHVTQMMLCALDHELLQAFSFLPIILVEVDLNFSRPKNAFPEVLWLFKVFLVKSGLVCSLWWSLCICSGEVFSWL